MFAQTATVKFTVKTNNIAGVQMRVDNYHPGEGIVASSTFYTNNGPFISEGASEDYWQLYEVGGASDVLGESFVAGGTDDILVDSGQYSVYDPQPVEKRYLLAAHTLTPDYLKTMWGTEDSELNGNLFREGTDKIVAAIQLGSGSGSSAGGAGDTAADSNREYMATQQRGYYDAEGSGTSPALALEASPMSSVALAAERSATAKTAIEAAYSARELPDLGSASDTGSSAPLTLTVPYVGTISLNPLDYAHISTMAAFIKTIIAWFLVYKFEIWLWNYFCGLAALASISVPAKGNPVAGGTGAQATSLVLASAVTAVLVSIPVLYWAIADTTVVFGFNFAENPFALAGSGDDNLRTALFLVNCYFPMTTAIAIAGQSFIVQKGGLVLIAGVQTVIRFFVV